MTVAYEYRAVSDGRMHHVFVVHETTPDWWRLVASFPSADRAEKYAFIENDCRDDEFPEKDTNAAPLDALPAPPLSAIIPDNFRPAPAPVPQLPAPPAPEGREDVPPVSRSGFSSLDLPAAAPSPSPAPFERKHPREVAPEEIERRVQAALGAIRALSDEDGKISYATVAERSGVPQGSIAPAIRALEERGIIEVQGHAELDSTELRRRGGIRLLTAPKISEAPQPKRRFTNHAEPEQVNGLAHDHAALRERRTLFPTTVVDPEDAPRLLVSGANQRKLGDRVTKGPWSGFPIYALTLEERATCPDTCHHWGTCYGNGMPMARRHRHGPDLIARLARELADLQRDNPRGFVVRLHVLGDFYSTDYVDAWGQWLDKFPALHVFGYTAWQQDTEIGDAVAALRSARWDRFAVRTSAEESGPERAVTIWRVPEKTRIDEGIVCPAQTEKTACCGSCGLCWSPAMRGETIAFVAHGRVGARPAEPAKVAPPVPFKPYKRGALPPSKQIESTEEFLARGGKITRVDPKFLEPSAHAAIPESEAAARLAKVHVEPMKPGWSGVDRKAVRA